MLIAKIPIANSISIMSIKYDRLEKKNYRTKVKINDSFLIPSCVSLYSTELQLQQHRLIILPNDSAQKNQPTCSHADSTELNDKDTNKK